MLTRQAKIKNLQETIQRANAQVSKLDHTATNEALESVEDEIESAHNWLNEIWAHQSCGGGVPAKEYSIAWSTVADSWILTDGACSYNLPGPPGSNGSNWPFGSATSDAVVLDAANCCVRQHNLASGVYLIVR